MDFRHGMIPTCALRWSKTGKLQQQWVYIPASAESYVAKGPQEEWRDVPTEGAKSFVAELNAAMAEASTDMKPPSFMDRFVMSLNNTQRGQLRHALDSQEEDTPF